MKKWVCSALCLVLVLAVYAADYRFPNWIHNANESANNTVAFHCFHSQGKIEIAVSTECEGFSLFINNHEIKTKRFVSGGKYTLDISKYTVDGINSLQVLNVVPAGIEDAVKIHIPYPTVIAGKASKSEESAFALIDRIIRADIGAGFPSAQLAVIKNGALIYENAWNTTTETLFDLASVTKMFSVNYALQYLASRGEIALDTRVVDILGAEFASESIDLDYPFEAFEKVLFEKQQTLKQSITVRDLLCHRAGMHPGPNYYSDRYDVETQTFDNDEPNKLYSGYGADETTREETLRQIFRTPLLYAPRTASLYSDVDYMLLGFIIEKITGKRLDVFLKETFFEPLGLHHITYNPLEHGFEKSDCAPTDLSGNTNGGALTFTGVRESVIQGEVHDAKAFYCMGGVSGHAGLFSNATDLAILASVMLTGGWGDTMFFSQNVIDAFCAPQDYIGADYGLGWWRNAEAEWPRHFGTLASSRAIGHQGFTGTLVFIEPEQNLVIVYLTNKINTPLIKGKELQNQYEGGEMQAGIVGFVPQIVLLSEVGALGKTQQRAFLQSIQKK
ncbi:MAG: serine hydrolase [Spirochaetaceae bacterium]|nr:serine hydrolase [Spirochaetaceae bacterium]